MTLRSDNEPWYKQRWPWLLMAGPIAVVIAGAVTVWLAVISNDGLVTDDYYKQGLAVNQTLQRDHQASSLGLEADVMRSGQSMRLFIPVQVIGSRVPGSAVAVTVLLHHSHLLSCLFRGCITGSLPA
jgi:hypothetical protein